MKVQIILRADGHPDAFVGESEAGDWSEMKVVFPALLRAIAAEFDADAAEEGP